MGGQCHGADTQAGHVGHRGDRPLGVADREEAAAIEQAQHLEAGLGLDVRGQLLAEFAVQVDHLVRLAIFGKAKGTSNTPTGS